MTARELNGDRCGPGPWVSNEEKVHLLTQFVLPHIEAARAHRTESCSPLCEGPLIIGLSGLQGTGKSTIAGLVAKELSAQGTKTAVISIDDFYLTFDDQQTLREEHPHNDLLRTRGQPGTHDLALARSWLEQFKPRTRHEVDKSRRGENRVTWPMFDKSAKRGRGDRTSTYATDESHDSLVCIILEGWCVGFQAKSESEIKRKHQAAVHMTRDENAVSSDLASTLPDHSIEDLCYVNDRLREYNDTFIGPEHLDVLIHLDTEDLHYVYQWRLEQEEQLRRTAGIGMDDRAVVDFVNAYMPAYELYLDGLRRGFYHHRSTSPLHRHLRVVNNRERDFVSAGFK